MGHEMHSVAGRSDLPGEINPLSSGELFLSLPFIGSPTPLALNALKSIKFDRLAQAGKDFIKVFEALTLIEETLGSNGKKIDDCWKGEDAAAAQKVLRLLHANAKHFASRSVRVGNALEAAGAARPDAGKLDPALLSSKTGLATMVNEIKRVDDALHTAYFAMPATLEKNLPELKNPDGSEPITGGTYSGGPPVGPATDSGRDGGSEPDRHQDHADDRDDRDGGNDRDDRDRDDRDRDERDEDRDPSPDRDGDDTSDNRENRQRDGGATELAGLGGSGAATAAGPGVGSGGVIGAQPYNAGTGLGVPGGIGAGTAAPGMHGLVPGAAGPGVIGAPGASPATAGTAAAAGTSANTGMPVGARGQPGREDEEEERATWLAEDLDVWRGADSPAPTVVE